MDNSRLAILCYFVFLFPLVYGFVYQQTNDARNAQTQNILGIGSPWTTNTILCESTSQTFLNNEFSDVLQIDHFGFSLPNDAQIQNISVTIEHSKYPWNVEGDFSLVALTHDKMQYETDNLSSSWNNVINLNTFPRSGSNWKKADWTIDEINNDSFGVRIRVTGAGFATIGCVSIAITFESKEVILPRPSSDLLVKRSAPASADASPIMTTSTAPPSPSPSPSPGTAASSSPTPSPSATPSSSPSSSTAPPSPSASTSPGSPASSSPSSSPSKGVSPSPSSNNGNTPKGGPSKNNTGLIAGIAAAIAAVAVGLTVAGLLFIKRRKQKKQQDSESKHSNVELQNKNNNNENMKSDTSTTSHYTSPTPSEKPDPHYSSFIKKSDNENYQPIKSEASHRESTTMERVSKDPKSLNYTIMYSELTLESEVGRGAFGVVYKARWRSNEVAVKQLITEVMTAKQTDEFVHEMALMRSLRPSPNVVLLLGICETPLCVVTEYCAKGSLLRLLESQQTITSDEIKKIVTGIAKGMLHLHFEGIIHRDLAARNVLLTIDMEPKISDFGLSRALQAQENSARTNSNVGPLKWMAPECIRNREYGTPSDVWAFGITLTEIFTRQPPYGQLDALSVATRIATGEMTPEIPKNAPPIVAELMQSCFAYLPNERVSFQHICDRLESWN